MTILTPEFWQAAGARALRGVLVAMLPFLAPLVTGQWDAIGQAGLALALAAAASLATSLASLPELGGGRSPWAAVLDRAGRQFGQTLAAAIGAALVWSDVDWALALSQAVAAALTTAVLAVVEQLPETVPLVEVAHVDAVPPAVGLTADERYVINDIRAIEGRPPLPGGDR